MRILETIEVTFVYLDWMTEKLKVVWGIIAFSLGEKNSLGRVVHTWSKVFWIEADQSAKDCNQRILSKDNTIIRDNTH